MAERSTITRIAVALGALALAGCEKPNHTVAAYTAYDVTDPGGPPVRAELASIPDDDPRKACNPHGSDGAYLGCLAGLENEGRISRAQAHQWFEEMVPNEAGLAWVESAQPKPYLKVVCSDGAELKFTDGAPETDPCA